MIGNDIVDIAATRIESNWQRAGFVQKLFTTDEQSLINSYHDPEIMVWILWSMKEAAYKIYNRETGIRAFIPHLIECSLNVKDFSGLASVKNRVYYTQSAIIESVIDTIAVTDTHYFSKVRTIKMARVLKDKTGLPYIISAQTGKVAASVSNHGRSTKAVYISN